MFLLNPQSKLPLYEQLVEQLRKQIVLGNAAPGSPLPLYVSYPSNLALTQTPFRRPTGKWNRRG